MKKLSMVFVLVLVTALCAVFLTACNPYSGDPKKDKEALEKKGYEVDLVENDADDEQTAILYARKSNLKIEELKPEDLLNPDTYKNLKVEIVSILYCKDSDTAKKYYDESKKALDEDKDSEISKNTKISQSGKMVISEVTVSGEDAKDFLS